MTWQFFVMYSGHFLKKIKAEPIDFDEVIQTITTKLQPIYNNLKN